MYGIQMVVPSVEVNEQEAYLLEQKPLIEQVIAQAVSATYSITDNHPGSAKGTILYNEVIAGIREQFVSQEFDRKCVNNIELTISQKRGIAFYFCRGNEQTGLNDAFPHSLRKKGSRTQQVLGLKPHGALNEDLFPTLNQSAELYADNTLTIWAILIYADFNGNDFRAELGIPLGVNRKGYIEKFERRIILDINGIIPQTDIIPTPAEYTELPDINIEPNERKTSAA